VQLITKSLKIIKESDFNVAQMGNPQSFFKLSIGKGPCYCLMRGEGRRRIDWAKFELAQFAYKAPYKTNNLNNKKGQRIPH